MKKQITIGLVLALIAFFLLDKFRVSEAQEEVNSEGKIGDVKYSVLDPDKFREVNGKGWVLLDGSNIENSKLSDFSKLKELPNASGVFIRGMNLGRDAETGDVDGNRDMGKLQLDAFQGHWHALGGFFNSVQGGGEPNSIVLSRKREVGWDPPRMLRNNQARDSTTDNKNGIPRTRSETRPRNIALYTYIKIND